MSTPQVTDRSRRQLLKVGAVGATLVWAVPTVQVLGMDAAHADTTSTFPTDTGGGGGSPEVLGESYSAPRSPAHHAVPGGGGSAGGGGSVSAASAVPATGSGGELAYTGAETGRTAALGVGALAAGAGLVAAARHLREADDSA